MSIKHFKLQKILRELIKMAEYSRIKRYFGTSNWDCQQNNNCNFWHLVHNAEDNEIWIGANRQSYRRWRCWMCCASSDRIITTGQTKGPEMSNSVCSPLSPTRIDLCICWFWKVSSYYGEYLSTERPRISAYSSNTSIFNSTLKNLLVFPHQQN